MDFNDLRDEMSKSVAGNRFRVCGSRFRPSGDPAPVGERREVLFRIRPRFTALLREDPVLALDWRLESRTAFLEVPGQGYRVAGFHRDGDDCASRIEAPASATSSVP